MLKDDSRLIEKNDTFIAIGKGKEYIEDAIKRGANRVIVESGSYEVETITVPSTKEYLIEYLKENYYDQIKDLKLIGATGTNGKTTTCFLIHKALNKLGIKCGYIGTIGFYMDTKIKTLRNTTPDILELYNLLLECKKQHCQYVVMEVSSHSLDMKRVNGLEYDYAIFSNLTKEHLDYHKTMENYALTKQKLFLMLKENGKAIINNDDSFKSYFLLEQNNNITYGFTKSDYQITEYETDHQHTNFSILHNGIQTKYNSALLGKHNVYNMLVTIIVLKDIGITEEQIENLTKELKAPDGRMETIKKGTNSIIIDYAHTPDGVLKMMDATKEIAKGHIYTIIGCGGDRDRFKRPIMAQITTDNSDFVIFTNDNPREEDPNQIIQDMIKGVDKNNYEIVLNREKAIRKGIQKLEDNDILLILGKGHEEYQIIGKQRFYFSDRKTVLDNI